MASLLDRHGRGRCWSRASWRGFLLAASATLLLAGAARADPPPAAANPCQKPRVTNFLAADATRPGVISLYFFHAEGARVTYFECASGRARRLGSIRTAAGTPSILLDATTWSCDRLTRRFAATATLADGSLGTGTYSVRTMSCLHRFELSAPRRAAPGASFRIRVVDRWGIGGIRARLCATPPGARRTCTTQRFPRGVAVATRTMRATAGGTWHIELRVRGHRARTAVVVGQGAVAAALSAPTLLATGDSMMQGVDGFLADDLGDAMRVRSDVRPGTGISKGDWWLRRSASQAARLRPSTTVMSIGGNEGWPMPIADGATAVCCGEPWVAEYARRVRTIMRTYLRDGRGRVIWLTLPAPRGGTLTPIFAAVNAAVLRAGVGLAGVTVLRIDLLFTPDGYATSCATAAAGYACASPTARTSTSLARRSPRRPSRSCCERIAADRVGQAAAVRA